MWQKFKLIHFSIVLIIVFVLSGMLRSENVLAGFAINTNVASTRARQQLEITKETANISFQRVSSGLRLNNANDDAVGLGVTQRIEREVGSLTQATKNTEQTIKLLNTVDEARMKIEKVLTQTRELSNQSDNLVDSDATKETVKEGLAILKETKKQLDAAKANNSDIQSESINKIYISIDKIKDAIIEANKVILRYFGMSPSGLRISKNRFLGTLAYDLRAVQKAEERIVIRALEVDAAAQKKVDKAEEFIQNPVTTKYYLFPELPAEVGDKAVLINPDPNSPNINNEKKVVYEAPPVTIDDGVAEKEVTTGGDKAKYNAICEPTAALFAHGTTGKFQIKNLGSGTTNYMFTEVPVSAWGQGRQFKYTNVAGGVNSWDAIEFSTIKDARNPMIEDVSVTVRVKWLVTFGMKKDQLEVKYQDIICNAKVLHDDTVIYVDPPVTVDDGVAEKEVTTGGDKAKYNAICEPTAALFAHGTTGKFQIKNLGSGTTNYMFTEVPVSAWGQGRQFKYTNVAGGVNSWDAIEFSTIKDARSPTIEEVSVPVRVKWLVTFGMKKDQLEIKYQDIICNAKVLHDDTVIYVDPPVTVDDGVAEKEATTGGDKAKYNAICEPTAALFAHGTTGKFQIKNLGSGGTNYMFTEVPVSAWGQGRQFKYTNVAGGVNSWDAIEFSTIKDARNPMIEDVSVTVRVKWLVTFGMKKDQLEIKYQDIICNAKVLHDDVVVDDNVIRNLLPDVITVTPIRGAVATGASKLSIDVDSNATAGTCFAITVYSRDSSNNIIAVITDKTVSLSDNSDTGQYYSDSECTSSTNSTTISVDTSSAEIYFKDTIASSITLEASASGLTSAMGSMSITAASASKLAFATAGQTMTAGSCSNAIIISTTDLYDNVSNVSSNKSINLSDNSDTGEFYSDSDCTNDILNTLVNAGDNSATVYFQDTVSGSRTLSVSADGFTGASQEMTVTVGEATHLGFSTPARTITAGSCSLAITIISTDAEGNATNVSSDKTVTLMNSSDTGVFYSDSNCINATMSTTIVSGTNSASVYFSDTTSGPVLLEFSAEGLVTSSQDLTTNADVPAGLVFMTGPQTVGAGVCSGATTVKRIDLYGNPTSIGSNTILVFQGSIPPPLISIYSQSNCTGALTDIILGDGTLSGTFYFKGNAAGSADINITSDGLVEASQTETIN